MHSPSAWAKGALFFSHSHVYKFPGADGGWYVDQLEGRDEDESDGEHASGDVAPDAPAIPFIPIVSADMP